jgi:hypothetical protein
MNAGFAASRLSRAGLAAALALSVPLSTLAAERTSGATLEVAVFPDGYVTAGVSFRDLDTLAPLVEAMNLSLLRLDACGPAAARALLAAAERFHTVRLDLRMLGASEPLCSESSPHAVRVSQAAGPAPVPAAHHVSEKYWRRVMP